MNGEWMFAVAGEDAPWMSTSHTTMLGLSPSSASRLQFAASAHCKRQWLKCSREFLLPLWEAWTKFQA